MAITTIIQMVSGCLLRLQAQILKLQQLQLWIQRHQQVQKHHQWLIQLRLQLQKHHQQLIQHHQQLQRYHQL